MKLQPNPEGISMSIDKKGTKILKEAKRVAQEADTWAIFADRFFNQSTGLIASEFPSDFERQAYYDSEAYKELNAIFLGVMKKHGTTVGSQDKSGRFVVRVPKTVHQRLEIEAKKEGVSLNQLALSKLSIPLKDELGIAVEKIIEAFNAVHDGYSTDYVIIHPEYNRRFLDRCLHLRLGGNERILNHKLMNIRKTSKYKGMLNKSTKRLDVNGYDSFEFAAEIAVRSLQRTEGVTLDYIICDPAVRSRFDQIARSLKKGVSDFEFRAAALNLRKGHRLQPMDRDATEYVLVSSGPLGKIDVSVLDELPGLYAIYDNARPLFAGETDNLRKRIKAHVSGGLPGWVQPTGDVILKKLVLPNESKQQRLNWLSQFINAEKPLLNYQRKAA